MGVEIITILISAFISLIVSVLVNFAYDRGYGFFNKGKEKYNIESVAPKILSGKRQIFTENIETTKIFTAEIVCSKETNDNEEIEPNWEFKRIALVDDADKRFDKGLHLSNQTDVGITLSTSYMSTGRVFDLSSLPARNIAPGGSIVLLYIWKDCPTKISAQFKGYEIEYIFSTNKSFIDPKCIKKI